jgi:hypothetical protein
LHNEFKFWSLDGKDNIKIAVTDITYPPYTPWGIRRLWGLGGLELFGIVVYMLEVSDYVR